MNELCAYVLLVSPIWSESHRRKKKKRKKHIDYYMQCFTHCAPCREIRFYRCGLCIYINSNLCNYEPNRNPFDIHTRDLPLPRICTTRNRIFHPSCDTQRCIPQRWGIDAANAVHTQQQSLSDHTLHVVARVGKHTHASGTRASSHC